MPWQVRAWATNRGGRTTPHNTTGTPYPTLAVLLANGDSVAADVWQDSIPKDQHAKFHFSVDPTPMPDMVLFSVSINPSQTYVELGADDNTGHALAIKP